MKLLALPALADQMTRWMPVGTASAQFIGAPPRRSRSRSPMAKLRLVNWMDEELQGTSNYYPHTLITYYYFRATAMKLPADGYIFGDSGGYSLRRHDEGISKQTTGPRHVRRFDPKDVLRWQSELCTVGAVVDLPPTDVRRKQIWGKALETTLHNVKSALPSYQALLRDGSSFRWWGVAHGWDTKDLDTWFQAVSAIYPFAEEGEGWCFKAQNPSQNPIAVAYCLHFIQQRKLPRVHFFAAVAPPAIATLLVLGPQAGIQFISTDAESPSLLARMRKIYVPTADGLNYTYLEERREERAVRNYLLQHCTCFSCERLHEEQEQWPDIVHGNYNEYWLYRFQFHNQLLIQHLVANLERAAAQDPDALLRTVLEDDYGKVLRGFDGDASHLRGVGVPKNLLDHLEE